MNELSIPGLDLLPATEWAPGREGIYLDLPEAVYRPAEGINISALKRMRVSPKHYKHGLDDPDDEKSRALVIGSVLHLATLQPELLAASYAIRPACWTDWRKKEAQAWREEQEGRGIHVISRAEADQVEGAVRAIREHPVAWSIISGGQREVAIFKRHARTGLLLKGKADVVTMDKDDRLLIADVKSCGVGEVTDEEFGRKIAKFLYHDQAAFYCDLLGASMFVFIAVEKLPPHDVVVHHLDPLDVELGHRQNERSLQRLAECRRLDVWPGYNDGIRTIGMSAWQRKRDGEDLE